jgi:hypothetical protein
MLYLITLNDTYTHTHTTLSRTPLYRWSARCRDLYLTTHNIHNREISIPPAGLEPTNSASDRLKTYAYKRAAAGIGIFTLIIIVSSLEATPCIIFNNRKISWNLFFYKFSGHFLFHIFKAEHPFNTSSNVQNFNVILTPSANLTPSTK